MRTRLRRALAMAFALLLGAGAVAVLAAPAAADDGDVTVAVGTPAPIHPGDVVVFGGRSAAGAAITGVELFGRGESSLGAAEDCTGFGSDEVAHDWSCSWTVTDDLPAPSSVTIEVAVLDGQPLNTTFDVVPLDPTLEIDATSLVYPGSPLSFSGVYPERWTRLEQVTATPAGGGTAIPLTPTCSDVPGEGGPSRYTCTIEAPIGQFGLQPGTWILSEEFSPCGGELPPVTASDTLIVTTPATIAVTSAPVHPGDPVAFGGSRVAAGGMSAFRVDDDLIAPSCTGAIGSTTAWSCAWDPATELALGSHTLSATFTDGATEESTVVTTTFAVEAAPVAPPTTTPPPTPPAPTPSPAAWTLSFGDLDLTNLHPGDGFTATGAGLPSGATITFVLHSTPVTLGSTTADGAGRFSFTGVIPAETALGAHEIIATVQGAGVATTSAARAVTITAPAIELATESAPESTTETQSDQSGGAAEEKSPRTAHEQLEPEVEPNVLTDGLESIGDVVSHPAKIPAAVAIGLVLLLFGVLPAHLLDATIAEQYEHAARRFPRLRSRPRWWQGITARLRRAPALGGLVITAATAVLFCFADPRFGLNVESLRLIIALAVALFVVTYVVDALTALIMRRAWDVAVTVSLRPLGLILSLAGVVVSRLLHFSPGFLIGLVLGLSIAGTAAGTYAWRAILLRSGIIIGLALAAWGGFSAFSHEGAEKDFTSALLLELLVAIATEGIVALLVELLPFHLLEGERLFRRSKLVWGAVYVLAVVVFVVAVVPWEGNWATLGTGLWAWLAILVAFAVLALGVYLFFRIRSRREHEVEHDTARTEPVPIAED